MSREEIKYEISKVLDHFSDETLEKLFSFLKDLNAKNNKKVSFASALDKILSEDDELLAKLAQ